MDNRSIAVEVVYALADKQKLLRLTVPYGTTVREAALRSGLDAHFPGLDLASSPLGIFGKAVAKPEERVLEDSYHVATLDNDAPRIFAESAEFIERVTSAERG